MWQGFQQGLGGEELAILDGLDPFSLCHRTSSDDPSPNSDKPALTDSWDRCDRDRTPATIAVTANTPHPLA
ncbi:hypothetical protein [Synechococcus sp. PCC 7336]|uniref:hypothetical protein n=1 Tax=Synechococcus sp. PCC 7336 TaxID=195250 RepID=UPI00034CBC4E|nr:hypothetical protein [Synechococcus sp. PCC 7336]